MWSLHRRLVIAPPIGNRVGWCVVRTGLTLFLFALAGLAIPTGAQAAEYRTSFTILPSVRDDEDNSVLRERYQVMENTGETKSHFVEDDSSTSVTFSGTAWFMQSATYTYRVTLTYGSKACSMVYETKYEGRLFDFAVACKVIENNGCQSSTAVYSPSNYLVSAGYCVHTVKLP